MTKREICKRYRETELTTEIINGKRTAVQRTVCKYGCPLSGQCKRKER